MDLGARLRGRFFDWMMRQMNDLRAEAVARAEGDVLEVDPALLETIRERYPDDQATGFGPGELRGLFWAVVE